MDKETKGDINNKFSFASLINKKNIKIILLLIAFLIAIIICLGIDSGNANKVNTSGTKESNSGYLTTLEYCSRLETRLEGVLSKIDGAGQIKVMITVDGSPELVYASDTDSKTSSSNSGTVTSTNSSSPIIVSKGGGSDALVRTENLPSVKGVIVVSSGAGNVGVKLDILSAVSKLLDISTDRISVLKGI